MGEEVASPEIPSSNLSSAGDLTPDAQAKHLGSCKPPQGQNQLAGLSRAVHEPST